MSEGVPSGLLREALGGQDCDWEATPMENAGYSGAPFFRVRSRVGASGAFVVKRWTREAWTAIVTGARRSREALAWKAGLLGPRFLGALVEAPVLCACETQGGAWIVMRDVSAEFEAFASSRREPDCFRLVLDRIACFHAATCGSKPPWHSWRWLYRQEARADLFASTYAAWLGHPNPEYRDTWKRIGSKNPGLHDAARTGFRRLLDLIPARDRALWERCAMDRQEFRRKLAGLPTCFLHGDMNERNFGLAGASPDTHVVAVDWEWAGWGTPALDVAFLIYHVILYPVAESPQDFAASIRHVHDYQEHYYERLVVHRGKMSRAEWDRSWSAALALSHVVLFSVQGGWALDGGVSPARVLAQVEYVCDLMRRGLGR